jgi:nucleoid-associated protein YgaU
MLGVVSLLVLGGAGAAIAIKIHHDNQVTAQRRSAAAAHARAAAAALAQQQAAQQAQQQKQARHAAQTVVRQAEETSLQQSITKDAQQQVSGGLLTGPILSTSCTPLSGGSSQNLASSSGTYECIAVNKINADGTSSGYRYSGTIDFSSGSTTWHLGG